MRATVQLGLALTVACCGYFATQAAAANEATAKKPNPHFSRLDINKDGFLSYQEARADKQVAGRFALSDENRDGRLSEDEYLKLKAALARQRGGNYNSDGLITSKVKLAVLKAKDMKSADVHVETIAGVVRLKGAVDTVKQAARAVQLAGRVQGVKKVESNLVVRK